MGFKTLFPSQTGWVWILIWGGLLLGLGEKTPWAFSIKKAESFKDVFNALASTSGGKDLLLKAEQKWKTKDVEELGKYFRWGETSRTDTTLTRQFNPTTGKEEKSRDWIITLRQDQPLLELVLDLAHELVHATAQPTYDPYDPLLTRGKYLLSILEGAGGEVDAVWMECEIGRELARKWNLHFNRCETYLSPLQRGGSRLFDKSKIRKGFYQVGTWKKELEGQLGAEARFFPLLSAEKPVLYSSTGHAPYPVALIREFEEITEAACNNSRKRMEVVSSELGAEANLQRFLLMRCQK